MDPGDQKVPDRGDPDPAYCLGYLRRDKTLFAQVAPVQGEDCTGRKNSPTDRQDQQAGGESEYETTGMCTVLCRKGKKSGTSERNDLLRAINCLFKAF
jgi:hypothetical protein